MVLKRLGFTFDNAAGQTKSSFPGDIEATKGKGGGVVDYVMFGLKRVGLELPSAGVESRAHYVCLFTYFYAVP